MDNFNRAYVVDATIHDSVILEFRMDEILSKFGCNMPPGYHISWAMLSARNDKLELKLVRKRDGRQSLETV